MIKREAEKETPEDLKQAFRVFDKVTEGLKCINFILHLTHPSQHSQCQGYEQGYKFCLSFDLTSLFIIYQQHIHQHYQSHGPGLGTNRWILNKQEAKNVIIGSGYLMVHVLLN